MGEKTLSQEKNVGFSELVLSTSGKNSNENDFKIGGSCLNRCSSNASHEGRC
jgi:hypothetical protein